MTKPKSTLVIDPRDLERQIFIVRGQRVMLDAHLAMLYGVATRALNQAVARNPERFPSDFAYQLTRQESMDLKSQIVTSKQGRGGTQKLPWVFHRTWRRDALQRLAIAAGCAGQYRHYASVCQAAATMATPGELVQHLKELAKTVQLHDGQIAAITDVLRRMMEPAPAPAKRKIGFRPEAHSNHDSNGQLTEK
jgi:ORF6N domain